MNFGVPHGACFAAVGLIFGYTLGTALIMESIAEFVRFLLRTPVQWLLTYALVFWSVRLIIRALFGGKAKVIRRDVLVVGNKNV